MTLETPNTSTQPLSVAPFEEVRWAFIGLGARGFGHLQTVLQLQNARVTAVCDTHTSTIEQAVEAVREKSEKIPFAVGADNDRDAWHRVLDRDDVDAVVISTAWDQHAPMAVEAMKAGKHAFLEVPAAVSIEECWQLVDTSEATGKHCMML